MFSCTLPGQFGVQFLVYRPYVLHLDRQIKAANSVVLMVPEPLLRQVRRSSCSVMILEVMALRIFCQ